MIGRKKKVGQLDFDYNLDPGAVCTGTTHLTFHLTDCNMSRGGFRGGRGGGGGGGLSPAFFCVIGVMNQV